MEIKLIVEQLKKEHQSISKDLVPNVVIGNKNPTQRVKKCLAELGDFNKFKVCASLPNEEFEKEWLYDLVWYKENEEGFLIDVPLVVECEWKSTRTDIKFDFEKLLLAKSSVKLMICNANENKKQEFLKYFQDAINISP